MKKTHKNKYKLPQCKYVLIFGIIGVCFFIIAALFLSQLQKNKAHEASLFSSPTLAIASVGKGKYQMRLYALGAKSIQEILDIHAPDTFGLSSPALDPKTGNIYYISDYGSISQYNFMTQSSALLYTLFDSKLALVDPLFTSSALYVTEKSKDFNTYDRQRNILEIQLPKRSIRIIGPVKQSAYTNAIKLFSYKGVDYTGAFGGDGCGGYGAIYNNVTQEELVKTGEGCDQNPRYIGTIPSENSVLLYSIRPHDTFRMPDNNPFTYKYDNIYAKNLVTGEITEIFSLKTIDSPNTGFVFNTESKKIGIVTENQLWIVDIKNKKLEKKINLPVTDSYFNKYFFIKNKFYLWIENQKKFAVVNTDTSAINYVTWNTPYATMWGRMAFLGTWNNQLIVAVRSE